MNHIVDEISTLCVKRIFKKCRKISTINRKAYFGKGFDIEIGENLGLTCDYAVEPNLKNEISEFVLSVIPSSLKDKIKQFACSQ